MLGERERERERKLFKREKHRGGRCDEVARRYGGLYSGDKIRERKGGRREKGGEREM